MKTSVAIAPAKLIDQLAKRGLTPKQASLELGGSASYLSNNISRRTMTKRTLEALKAKYGITWEDIRPEPEKPPEPPAPDITMKLVEEAVYQALSRLNIEELFYRAMQRALNE